MIRHFEEEKRCWEESWEKDYKWHIVAESVALVVFGREKGEVEEGIRGEVS